MSKAWDQRLKLNKIMQAQATPQGVQIAYKKSGGILGGQSLPIQKTEKCNI